MKNFFRTPFALSFLILIALSLFIWFLGPLIKFGESNFSLLANANVRFVSILCIFLLWGIYNFIIGGIKTKNTLGLTINENSSNADENFSSDLIADELHYLSNRLQTILKTINKFKFPKRRGGQALYELPWYLFIGPQGAGKSSCIINSGLHFPFADQLEQNSKNNEPLHKNCDFYITNEAVLLDTQGRFIRQDSKKGVDKAVWAGFLDLIKKHRARRPINGLVVVVNVQDLLTQSDSDIELNAKHIRNRIDELMVKFEIRFPIYLIVNKFDSLVGFNEFNRDLDKDKMSQVWGVTLPNTPKPDQGPDLPLLGRLLDKLVTNVNQHLLHLLNNTNRPAESAAIIGFPVQLEHSIQKINLFLSSAFKKNRFEIQPYLRGVYFSSCLQGLSKFDVLEHTLATTLELNRSLIET